MRVFNVLLTTLIMFFFICTGFAGAKEATQGKIIPEENEFCHKIIHLDTMGYINPSEAAVKSGTTVVWINHAKVPVEICFVGKQITMACKSPVHFVLDEDGSFISNRIPNGAVASICVIEKGEFKYLVRTIPKYSSSGYTKSREFKGSITVQ